jgi:hypothetical protein
LTQSVSPNTVFRIEFFASDPVVSFVPFSINDEGEFFLGSTNVTTDASGHASFDVTLPVKSVGGQIITATATDPDGNTSEFSAGLFLMGASGRTDPRTYPSLISIKGSTGIVTLTGVSLPSAPFQANPGQTLAVVTPFPGFTGEVHRAVGDLNGDAIPDVVYAPGSGMSPLIHIVDGSTQATINNFYAFDPKFKGGVYVALADVNGDGVLDLIVAAGAGGAPEVKVINGTKLRSILPNSEVPASDLLADFYAYDPHFKGGVTVAAADLNCDGHADIITGAGPGGASLVKIIDGTKLHQLQSNSEIANSALISQFDAYSPSFSGGVFVAVGDVNDDGVPDVITGPGAGPSQQVKVIDGTKLNVLNGAEISDSALLGQFYAFGPKFKGGVRVDAVDVNRDGHADIVLGAGGGTEIKVVDGSMVGAIIGQPPPSAILLDFMLDLSSPTGLPTPMPLPSGLQVPPPGAAPAALVDAVFGSTNLGSQAGLSPDIGAVDLSKINTDPTNDFPIGRTLRDDVTDAMFQLVTGNDGLHGSLVEFPYIGRPSSRPGWPKA